MSKHARLEDVLTTEQIGRAFSYYSIHKEHVQTLIKGCNNAFEPTESEDKVCPMIWKANHWKWFLSYL